MEKQELKEVGKGLSKSWTVWVNLALIAVSALLQQEPELLRDLLGDAHFATAVQLIAAANLILRTKTEVQKQP